MFHLAYICVDSFLTHPLFLLWVCISCISKIKAFPHYLVQLFAIGLIGFEDDDQLFYKWHQFDGTNFSMLFVHNLA